MTEERCELYDLPVTMCAHCRGHREAPPDDGLDRLIARLAPTHPTPRVKASYAVRLSLPFPARYDGECATCDGAIFQGDSIRMLDGAAVHDDADCYDDETSS